MKKIAILLMIVAAFLAFYEQGKIDKNPYVMIISFVVLMFGLMILSGKIPNKKTEDDGSEI